MIDLTGSDDDEHVQPAGHTPMRAREADGQQPAKRARHDEPVAAAGTQPPARAANGAATVDLAALRREREARRPVVGQSQRSAEPPPFLLLRTCAELGSRPAHTTTFEELTAGEWEWAIFSNYLFCPVWLQSACASLTRCPLILLAPVQQPESHLARWAASTAHSASARVHLLSPPLPDPYGSHHSKFALLFSKTGVRVIVHTANALYHDVRDMTQGVWSQDFPRRPSGAPAVSAQQSGQFCSTLHDYLHAALARQPRLELSGRNGARIVASAAALLEYDFSAANCRLLASVPGRHRGADLDKWGLSQLAALLRAEPAAAAARGQSRAGASEVCESDELVLQFSSFSSIGKNAKFWHQLIAALSTQPASARPAGAPALGPPATRPLRAHVVWPTEEEVRTSHIGYAGGTSMPSREEHVQMLAGSAELRGCIRRWRSPPPAAALPSARAASAPAAGAQPDGHALGRARFTPHLKSYVRFDPVSKRVAWVALTSSNLSMAAWGTLEKANTASPQLFIKSYELGVLLTPTTLANGRAHAHFDCQAPTLGGPSANAAASRPPAAAPAAIAMVPMHEAAAEGAARALLEAGAVPLPLPYALIPPAYGPTDVPWVSSVMHALPDRFNQHVPHAQLYGRDKDGITCS